MKFRRNQLEYRYSKLADSAAGDTLAAMPFGYVRQDIELKRLELLPLGALTANDTNYATITVKYGAATLASFNTKTSGSGGSGNWVSGTPIQMTLATTSINGGTTATQLTVEIAKAASGVSVPNCLIQLQALSRKELA